MPENGSRLDRIEAILKETAELHKTAERQKQAHEQQKAEAERQAAMNEVLRVNIESLHASVSELHGTALQHTEQLRTDADHIRALARIAEIHERRISDLEEPDGPSNT